VSLADIQDPRARLAAIAEFDDMGREAFLTKCGFGQASEYFLVHDGNAYDSKAIVGAAHGYEFPVRGPLRANEFSGGEATVERKLRQLGFHVERRTTSSACRDWSGAELTAITEDYFSMLLLDLRGEPYSKQEHRQALLPRLESRSKGSVEFKHQNISAVLAELGMPYIEGYKPRRNYQAALRDAVEEFLESDDQLLAELQAAADRTPDTLPVARARVEVGPPKSRGTREADLCQLPRLEWRENRPHGSPCVPPINARSTTQTGKVRKNRQRRRATALCAAACLLMSKRDPVPLIQELRKRRGRCAARYTNARLKPARACTTGGRRMPADNLTAHLRH